MVIFCFRENISSSESCNVCSTTSPDEMTSVRMCYCKQKDNEILDKKDNDVRIHDRDGCLATTSKKSITNEAYGISGGSPRRTSVIGEKTVLNTKNFFIRFTQLFRYELNVCLFAA